MFLHRDERRELVLDGIVLHGMELVRPTGVHADVSHVSSLDYIVKRLYHLFNWSLQVKTMALQNVDVIKLQPFQAYLYPIKYVFTAQTVLIDIVHSVGIGDQHEVRPTPGVFRNSKANLRHHDDLLSWKI